MAFTKKEHDDLLREIAMTGGDTPKMLELMQKLRDDFDEREGMLRQYGEKADKTPPEGIKEAEEKVREESRKDDREDGGERRRAYGVEPDRREGRRADAETGDRREVTRDMVSRAEYDELKKKYIDRFFSSIPEAIREEKEDVRKDDNVDSLTFEDLFKKREG